MALNAKLAYSVTRLNGQTGYLARVRLFNRLCGKDVPCGAFLGMGDSRSEAESDAMRYAREQLHRESIPMPDVESIGRLPRHKFDSTYFE